MHHTNASRRRRPRRWPLVAQQRARADFSTVASHQLRTPISIIRWALDMVLADRGGSLSPKQREYLERAYQQNSFLARIVGDLLRISRIEAGELTLTLAAVNLAALIRTVVQETAMIAKAYNCQVRVVVSPRVPKVTTDALKLKEVVHILVDNAIRYGRREGRVVIAAIRRGRAIALTVQDRGIGIPRRQQKNIFSIFFRAENAIRSQTEGLGVELYIARQYLKAMGSSLGFRSAVGQGSTFTVTIPLDPPSRRGPSLPAVEPPLSRVEFHRVAEHLREAVLVLDASFRTLAVNQAAARLLGVDRESVAGQFLGDLVRLPSVRQLTRRPGAGEATRVIRLRFPGDDHVGTYDLRLVPVHEQDVIVGWVVVIRESLAHLRRHAVAMERMLRVREFVTLTVHELNAPLGVSKWSLELLKRQMLGKLNAEQRGLVDQVYRNNERLLALVRDLLNLSKLEQGRFTIAPRVTDLTALIGEVVVSFQATAATKSLRLQTRQLRRLPRVLADGSRIAQVVTNVMSNAVKYTPRGGRITVSARRFSAAGFARYCRRTKVAAAHSEAPRGYLVVSVRDTGIGIPPDAMGKVFTKFFRTPAALRMKVEGTGLGLYIAKAIVELHQGDLWCTSKLGVGSTFSFSLPMA